MDKLAVYVHWPYCARICPYCDFNVYKGTRNEALIAAICNDLKHWRSLSGEREILSIHFGGGTPSLMSASNIEEIIKSVDELWGLPSGAEIGLEANPNDASSALWQDYRQAGVNRLSLGVQSFHDPALKLLGRDHDSDKAKEALKLARQIFGNVSLDLIFGWAGQTSELLSQDIDTALSFDPTHISTYQLTIEPDTAFDRAEQRGQSRAVNNDMSADFYERVCDRLIRAGFEHYEVSNFARNGKRSEHNLAYWQGHDYVGGGPGAHGRVSRDGKRTAYIAAPKPDEYITNVEANEFGAAEIEALEPADWAAEYLLMGLRIPEGISLSRFEEIGGAKLSTQTIVELQEEGLIKTDAERLAATDKGRVVLNAITEKLLA